MECIDKGHQSKKGVKQVGDKTRPTGTLYFTGLFAEFPLGQPPSHHLISNPSPPHHKPISVQNFIKRQFDTNEQKFLSSFLLIGKCL